MSQTRLSSRILVLLAVGGFLLTGIIFYIANENAKDRLQTAFANDASRRASDVLELMKARLNSLNSLHGYFQGNEKVEYAEFKGVVLPMLAERGVQAYGWVPLVKNEDRDRMEKEAREMGFEGFQITHRNNAGFMGRAEKQDYYYPIYWMEPRQGNELAIGYDLAAEVTQLEALERARARGEPCATEPLLLSKESQNNAQGIRSQYGFLVAWPIYHEKQEATTVEQKRSALKGFVFAIFRPADLIQAAVQNTSALDLPVDLYGLNGSTERRLLCHWESKPGTNLSASNIPELSTVTPPQTNTFDFAGRQWQVVVSAGSSYVSSHTSRAYWIVLPVGLALTALLLFYASALITSQRRAEQMVVERTSELKERESILQVITGSAQDAILLMDREGKVRFWNPAAERILGWSEAEAMGRHLRDFFTEKSFQAIEDYAQARLAAFSRAGGAGKSLDLVALRKDKTEIPVELSLSKAQLHGELDVVGILRDVTERRITEESLRRERILMRTVIDHLPQVIYAKDLEGRKTLANRKEWAHMGLRSEAETLGKTDFDIYSKDIAEQFHIDDQKVFETGQAIMNREEMLIDAKGQKHWLLTSKMPLHDEKGEIIGLVGIGHDITERKQGEEALQRERILMRTLIDHLPDAVYVKDKDARKQLANRVDWENLGAQNEAEVMGKTDFDFFAPEVASGFYADDQVVLQTGTAVINREEFLLNSKGQQWWLLTTKLPLRDEQGNITGLVGIGRDITARKVAEERLKRERILLRTVIDHLPHNIYVKDIDGRKTLANRAELDSMGYKSEDEAVGKTDFDVYPKAMAEKFFADDEAVLKTAKPVLNREEIIIGSKGEQRWLLTSKIPLHDENNHIIGLVGIGHDITDRKRAEENLRLLSQAVQQSPASIVILDQNGKIEYVNRKFTELTDYSLEDVRSKPFSLLRGSGTSTEVFAELMGQIQSGREWQGELHCRRKNGANFWEEALISPVSDFSGKVSHFVAIKEDITDRKRSEVELRKAKDAAETANHAKSEFLANMSHEIRTPMNGVIGMTGLLLDTELSSEQREYGETIRNSGEVLLAIINDILDFSKIEAGKLDLEMLDFDLPGSIEETADLLALKAQQKGLEFVTLIDPDVPVLLRGDPGRLRQILTNLAGNAIKFTSKGEVSIHLSLESANTGSRTVRFEVVDTGIGIPPEMVERLFSPFTQVDASTTRKFGGTGLGLSISKRLVEMMGGRIGIESVVDKGSKFWFTAVFNKPSEDGVPGWKPAADIAGHRVLVVDDNATNRRLLSVLMKSWGCHHEEAPDGQSGLEKLRQAQAEGRPFEIAILDMHMPGMDGEELGRKIKEDPALKQTLLVMLTSLNLRGEADRLRQIGFAGYLTKPVKQNQLYQCLAAVMGRPVTGDAKRQNRQMVTRDALTISQRRRFRILLAEDNVTNQRVALGILTRLGYRADAVANGAEAVKTLETIPYDLVLMDCMMPEMDGYAATQLVRSPKSKVPNHDIPIIAMTAYAMQGDREKCLGAGMSDYVTKPINPTELAEAMDRWLGRNTTGEESAPIKKTEAPPPKDLVFDQSSLVTRLMGDEDLARSIIEEFITDISRQIEILRQAMKDPNISLLERTAHTIKGAAGNVGAPALRDAAGAVEKIARTGNQSQIPDAVAAAATQFEQLKSSMLEFLKQGKKDAPI